ncbi:MAG: hypothetical protein IKI49_03270, partial [Oscillospiraceae bacterium]|nr:hypothetical protein [Oscillospiraceae bacterium]
MKSKTSFFDKAIFRRNIKSFWPLWLLFVAIELIVFALGVVGGDLKYVSFHNNPVATAFDIGNDLIDAVLAAGAAMNLVAGLIFAMLIFSYLTNARSAGGFASLPIKRETMFITNYLSGIIIFICGIVITGVVCLLIQAGTCLVAESVEYILMWALISVLQFILFYSLAIFVSMLTGHIVAIPILYLIINFLGMALNAVIPTLISMLLYGYPGSGTLIPTWLSPVVYMTGFGISQGIYNQQLFDDEALRLASGAFGHIGYLYAFAAAGVVLAVLALLMFRKRRMENASDVVAVNALRPVFKYCMTFGFSLFVGLLIFSAILNYRSVLGMRQFIALIICMVGGAFIGYFVSKMLMDKTFRVFRKGWLGFAVCAVLIIGLLAGCRYNGFGYERRIPEPEDIKSVKIDGAVLEEPENIARVRELHASLIKHKNEYMDANGIGIGITYMLKNGDMLQRAYTVPDRYDVYNRDGTYEYYEYENEDIELYGDIMTSPEALIYALTPKDFAVTEKTVVGGTVSYQMPTQPHYVEPDAYPDTYTEYSDMWISPEQAFELYDAVMKDAENGNIEAGYWSRRYTYADNRFEDLYTDIDIYIELCEDDDKRESEHYSNRTVVYHESIHVSVLATSE